MERIVRPRLRGFTHNPHFWAVIFIILALTFLYYAEFFIIDLSDPRWHWLWRLVVFEFNNNINGSLFCIPIIYAAITFGWRGSLTSVLFSIALLLPRIRLYTPDSTSFAINIAFLLFPWLVVLIIALQIKWRETVRKASAEREEERQDYIAQILRAQEDERKRISREIHDDTTQRLWIAANQIKRLATDKLRNSAPQTAEELETIRETILNISDDARRLSLALRPGILDDLGPVPAIRWLVDELNSKDSIEAKILVEGLHRQLNHEISSHLFRIAQEALNNVRRHSEATQVIVTLEFNPETVKMIIRDNGKGFSVQDIDKLRKQGKLGITGIQERIRMLNGIFNINSKLGKGTILSVVFKT